VTPRRRTTTSAPARTRVHVELPDTSGRRASPPRRPGRRRDGRPHGESACSTIRRPPPLDDTTRPDEPEALVYEKRHDGTLKLGRRRVRRLPGGWEAEPGAVEAAASSAEFDPNPGTRFGLPPFYALHAWVWKPNPTPLTGIFAAWNPRVTC
jgi:hypothetical protein